jgi:hypothetical protein
MRDFDQNDIAAVGVGIVVQPNLNVISLNRGYYNRTWYPETEVLERPSTEYGPEISPENSLNHKIRPSVQKYRHPAKSAAALAKYSETLSDPPQPATQIYAGIAGCCSE